MPSHFISPAAAGQAIVVTIVLIVVSIILSGILGSLGFLGLIAWLLLLGGIAVGAFLIVRGGRPVAGVGAILMPLSIWIALYTASQSLIPFWWTSLFFIGAVLLAWGTRADTAAARSWPIALLRIVTGWGFVSQAVAHFSDNWLPDGGNYLQSATTAGNRQPLWPLDPAYQGFLKGVVVPGGGQWASLHVSGELVFGLLMAMGAFTPVAAVGLLWLSANIILNKGLVAQPAYTDKLFFTGELICLITVAGLAYGLDAALRRHAPSTAAQWLMGEEAGPAAPVQAEPAPA